MDFFVDTGRRAAGVYLAAGGGQRGTRVALALFPEREKVAAADIVRAECAYLRALGLLPIQRGRC